MFIERKPGIRERGEKKRKRERERVAAAAARLDQAEGKEANIDFKEAEKEGERKRAWPESGEEKGQPFAGCEG